VLFTTRIGESARDPHGNCHYAACYVAQTTTLCDIQCESKKSPLGDLTFFHFFHKRLRIYNRFFTHLLNVPILARLQIFIQLSLILTKLCHIKRDYPVHVICAKCPKCAKTRAFRRLRKSMNWKDQRLATCRLHAAVNA